ncbi:MAG: nitroreductase family protein [Dehalococcoidia bacterium]|nr:nitroreductase family protein [Dehalococcoidia bacterium]
MDAIEAIASRRSLRQLSGRAVPDELVERVVANALLAPAPHHTKPWRYGILGPERRHLLATRMGDAWRADLERDGQPAPLIERLLRKSRRQIVAAPALVLACLTHEGLRDWPDERRARHEWAMAQQSVGAGMQNLMLAAHAMGLASYWISAPLFAPDAVRAALELPPEFVAQAFVVLGYASSGATPKPRAAPDASALVVRR